MSSVLISTEVVYPQRSIYVRRGSAYSVDLWREVQRRWLVGGVLFAVLLAAVCPRAGAPGGNYRMLTRVLRAEYVRQVPLAYIYFRAGRAARTRPPAPTTSTHGPHGLGECGAGACGRLWAVCALHAHVVSPALCVLTAHAFRDAVIDYRIVKGAILSCVGAPCGWLSLSLVGEGEGEARLAAGMLVASYVTSLVAAPLARAILCGRITVPPIGGILSDIISAGAPFAAGALWPSPPGPPGPASRLLALVVVYAGCCAHLADAEGSLLVGDVLVTLALVVGGLVASACSCWLYARCGLLARGHVRVVALCALPKCIDAGWHSSSSCSAGGLSLVPAAFHAPTQALIMAAIACHALTFTHNH